MHYGSLMLRHPGDDRGHAEELIESKHRAYVRRTAVYRALYYATRLGTGLSAGGLPFVIQDNPFAATALSLTVVVLTVFDTVFAPKEKWALYSRASDHLAVSRLKIAGQYERYKEAITILVETEAKALDALISLDQVIEEARTAKDQANSRTTQSS